MKLEIDSFGDKQLSRELLRFQGRSDNMRPVLNALADDFLALEKKQFDSQGGFASGGWRRLSASRIEEKRQQGLDPRILHATLALRKSLTQKGAKGAVRRITRDEMRVGTTIPYAVHHQHGAPRANLPRRRPVELREQDRRRWMKALQRFLVEGTVGISDSAFR